MNGLSSLIITSYSVGQKVVCRPCPIPLRACPDDIAFNRRDLPGNFSVTYHEMLRVQRVSGVLSR